MNFQWFKLVSTVVLTAAFVGLTSCSEEGGFHKDKDKISNSSPGKQQGPSSSGDEAETKTPAGDDTVADTQNGRTEEIKTPDKPETGTVIHPIDGPKEDEDNNNNGPGDSSDTDHPDEEATAGEEESNSDPDGGEQPPGEAETPSEEEIFALITASFEFYLPRGIYKGSTEDGKNCQITVKPFKNAGKDLIVEVESSEVSSGASIDKFNITLAPGQKIIPVGAPQHSPPFGRMWVQVIVPHFSLLRGMLQAVKFLSVKFDSATTKAQKVYIFDQTRESMSNTSINCTIESFEPEVVGTPN